MNKLLMYRPPRIAFGLLLMSIALWFSSPIGTVLFIPYKMLGIINIVFGFTIMMVAWLQFKRTGTAVCPTAKTSTLITAGIYRYTRNPMYLGMFLILLGASFFMGTIPSLLAPAAFFLIIDKVFIPYEENKLIMVFGDLFREYMKTVRRWL